MVSKITEIHVKKDAVSGTQFVVVPYHEEIKALLKSVDATFDRVRGGWTVAANKAEKFDTIYDQLVKTNERIQDAHREASAEGLEEAKKIRNSSGEPEASHNYVIDYSEREKPTFGDIVAKNDYFAAQLTGFSKKDGAAILHMHSLDRFSTDAIEHMAHGSYVSVTYDQKNRARVEPAERTTATERLSASFGHEVDGVRVDRAGENLQIKFAYNEPLKYRLNKAVPDAKYDKEAVAHVVPVEKMDDVARAVSGMRREFVAQQHEREHISSTLNAWMDKPPKLSVALSRDGSVTTGTIVEITDRFVAQSHAPGQVVLHHKGALKREGVEDGEPAVMRNEKVNITYAKGRGHVEPAKERTTAPERKNVAVER